MFRRDAPSSLTATESLIDEIGLLDTHDVVICPGSRSAPLSYAAMESERQGRIRLHVRVDERSAAFFALGLAKASGSCVAIITTSGTAVANLEPALLEARHAGVPLLAVTADRPSTLVGTGSNQTTDQLGIFGAIPRAHGRISANDDTPPAWRSLLRRLVIMANGTLTGLPGPVHLNVELPAPLIGQISSDESSSSPASSVREFRVTLPPPPNPVTIPPEPLTVVVAGDLTPTEGRALADWAAARNLPLLPEPSSNARFGPAAISLYRHLVSGFAPAIERVFVYGHPTLSRPITALLSDPVREIVAVTLKPEWNDPGWAVSQVIPAAEMEPGDPAWLESWKRADAALRPLADELAGIALTGPRLATSLLGSLTKTDRLVLGPSSPIRDADIAPIGSTSPCVYSNRGLAGIDGVIATALGVATAPTSADGCSRTTALVGDLTALHDLTALAIPRLERRPTLRLIIADDHGGSIFSTLEYGAGRDIIGDFADDFGRLFTVPVDVDFPAAARAFGATARTVTTVEEFETALSEPIRDIEVIHARLAESPRRAWNEELASQGTDIVKNIVTPLLNGAGLPLSS